MNNSFISINNLHKSYDKKNVLNGISINVKKGTFFGLFGKNGAGKSTLFKNILGLTTPTKGTITLAGENVSSKNKVSIGYLPENVALYSYLSVADNLQVAALSAGNELSKDEIKNILSKVNLEGSANTLVCNLSLGMKRRLQFAMATMTKPVDLLILDEPTNGMDVNGVLWLKNYLLELKEQKITILVCSHSLNIMEDLIDEYCIIKNGRVERHDVWKMDLNQKYTISIPSALSEKDKDSISEIGKITSESNQKFEMISEKKIYEVTKFFIEQDIIVDDINMVKNNLEDIFIESVAAND